VIRLACAKCNRTITHPVEIAGAMYGSTCARAVTGAKPARRKVERKARWDDRTLELFGVTA
jgi:hypothetical protein